MDQIALSHQQKLALEKLRGIVDEMKEVGLELYQEYAPTLEEAGVSWQELEALKNDIHLFGTKLKSFQVITKKLRSSAVTITRLDVHEILYKQENTSTARMIEDQLLAQGPGLRSPPQRRRSESYSARYPYRSLTQNRRQ